MATKEERRKAQKFVSKFIKTLVILALVFGIVVVASKGLKKSLSVSTTGTSIGQSFRAGNNIVTLTRTLEADVPTLHRNIENNRYRIALLVSPVDNPVHERLIPISDGYRSNDLRLAHIIGFDGTNVWCDADQIEGVNLETGNVVGAEELQQANPAMDQFWDDIRRLSLIITTKSR